MWDICGNGCRDSSPMRLGQKCRECGEDFDRYFIKCSYWYVTWDYNDYHGGHVDECDKFDGYGMLEKEDYLRYFAFK